MGRVSRLQQNSNHRSISSRSPLQNKLETVPLAANYSQAELQIVQKPQRPKEIMKKICVFTFIAALAVCATQLSQAQGNKEAKEANKLARDGADASKNQEWDKAIELLTKATSMDHKYAPNLSAVYQQRAYAAASNQQFQDAINDYGEALKISPDDPRIYEQRAAVEMKANDMDKALADYSQAIKLKPNEARYYGYRGYIYEVKGDINNSMADTDKVLKLDPKNQEAQNRKKRLETLQSMRATPIPASPAASPKTSPTGARKPHKP
jgi:tetratricopeptide (TPR) repeat protein